MSAKRAAPFIALLSEPKPPTTTFAGSGEVVGRLWGADIWVNSAGIAPPINDAPADGESYGRRDDQWQRVVSTSGDVLTGPLRLAADPVALDEAATRRYVDAAVASGSLYAGGWQVAANDPPLNPPAEELHHGTRYLCLTANPAASEIAPSGMPGLEGKTISNGDFIVWDAVLSPPKWDHLAIVQTGGLTEDLATTLFLSLQGGTVTGPITLPGAPGLALQAANRGYVDAGDALRTLKSGDTFLGRLTLTPGLQTLPADAATVGHVEAIAAEADLRVLKAGDTMTGPLVLSGPPVGTLDAAPRSYVDSADALKINRAGDTMGGLLTLFAPPTVGLHAVTKTYTDTADALRVIKTGDVMSGQLSINRPSSSVVHTNTTLRIAHCEANGDETPTAGQASMTFYNRNTAANGGLRKAVVFYRAAGTNEIRFVDGDNAALIGIAASNYATTVRSASPLRAYSSGEDEVDLVKVIEAMAITIEHLSMSVSHMERAALSVPRAHAFAGRGHG